MLLKGSYGVIVREGNIIKKTIDKKKYLDIERKILKCLSKGDYICKYLDTDVVKKTLLIEYAGINLAMYRRQKGVLNYSHFYQCLAGINYIHSKNIIHSDIKEENICILNNRIKIIDFGLSQFIGTNSFLAYSEFYRPDEVDNGICIEPKSDIYALGVLFLQNISNGSIKCRGHISYYKRILDKENILEYLISKCLEPLSTRPVCSEILPLPYTCKD